jgi:phosphatidylglycerophosphatase A
LLALDRFAGTDLPSPPMSRFFAHVVGTFLGVGHIPVIPATWTSLAVALLFLVVPIDGVLAQLGFVALALVLGVPAAGALERQYGKDPKQATIDEVAGMAITLVGVPLTARNVLAAFVLFRIFDVLKPPPARRLESLPGGWGIMADDVAAGIYARIVMQGVLWLLVRIAA